MTYTLEIKLDVLPNISTNGGHGHWSKIHRERKRLKELVRLAVGFSKPEKPLEKAICTFTRHSTVEPDFDNLCTSFKSCVDGLVECGVLANDKQSNIGQSKYQWAKGKRGEGFVTIRVEEIP